MSKFTKEELEKRITDLENFIKKRDKSKQNMVRFPFDPDKHSGNLPADVVVAEAFGQLKEVVIGGIDKEGKWWFSCSSDDDAKILWILENFKIILIDASPQREFNEGREI